jgi:hypothetical protein
MGASAKSLLIENKLSLQLYLADILNTGYLRWPFKVHHKFIVGKIFYFDNLIIKR